MSTLMTTSQFNDHIRQAIAMVATGEQPELPVTDFMIMQYLSEADQKKITPSYLRTTCNRVPEVKEIGCVSVKRVDGDPDRGDGFYITIKPIDQVKANQRRTLTPDEQRKLRNSAAAKALRELLSLTPDFSDLSPEDMVTSVMAVKRMHEIIKQRIENMEEAE